MGKRIQIATYLTVEQLEDRYRHETDGITRTHWQVVWQIAAGSTVQAVAASTGYSQEWIRDLVHRYNAQGPTGVGDQRHHNPGGQKALTPEQEAELVAALQEQAPGGDTWSGPAIAQWIGQRTGRSVTAYCGWLWLRRLNYRLLVPRPHHIKADPDAQAAFKKTARHRSAGASRPPRDTADALGV